jgi:hypothetical protein
MANYMAIDGSAWRTPEDFNDRWDKTYNKIAATEKRASIVLEKTRKKLFPPTLPHYIDTYGSEKFGYVVIPMSVMKDAVMKCGDDISQDFATFDDYHKWFVRQDILVHSARNRWPVILDNTGDSLLQDGWHRFHRYVQLKLLMVPCLYYPNSW